MSDWFSFWSPKDHKQTENLDDTLKLTAAEKKALGKYQVGQSALTAVESLTGLANIPLYKAERDNTKKAIENQVLAGQDEIIKSLSYNTDQALVYASRGNVSIGSPVIRSRMQKGAEEAGFDMAMLRSNAEIQKINADISYSQKRRAAFDNAMKGVFGAISSYGMAEGLGLFD